MRICVGENLFVHNAYKLSNTISVSQTIVFVVAIVGIFKTRRSVDILYKTKCRLNSLYGIRPTARCHVVACMLRFVARQICCSRRHNPGQICLGLLSCNSPTNNAKEYLCKITKIISIQNNLGNHNHNHRHICLRSPPAAPGIIRRLMKYVCSTC